MHFVFFNSIRGSRLENFVFDLSMADDDYENIFPTCLHSLFLVNFSLRLRRFYLSVLVHNAFCNYFLERPDIRSDL